jgi:hypothetical protein
MAETPTELRETERRVLAHLPAYRSREGHEQAIAEALEYGTIQDAGEWPKGRDLDDLTARVAADQHSKIEPGDGDTVRQVVETLERDGLVKVLASDEIRMTEAGLAALTA